MVIELEPLFTKVIVTVEISIPSGNDTLQVPSFPVLVVVKILWLETLTYLVLTSTFYNGAAVSDNMVPEYTLGIIKKF